MKLYVIYNKEYNPYSKELDIKAICTDKEKSQEMLDKIHSESGFRFYEITEIESNTKLDSDIF